MIYFYNNRLEKIDNNTDDVGQVYAIDINNIFKIFDNIRNMLHYTDKENMVTHSFYRLSKRELGAVTIVGNTYTLIEPSIPADGSDIRAYFRPPSTPDGELFIKINSRDTLPLYNHSGIRVTGDMITANSLYTIIIKSDRVVLGKPFTKFDGINNLASTAVTEEPFIIPIGTDAYSIIGAQYLIKKFNNEYNNDIVISIPDSAINSKALISMEILLKTLEHNKSISLDISFNYDNSTTPKITNIAGLRKEANDSDIDILVLDNGIALRPKTKFKKLLLSIPKISIKTTSIEKWVKGWNVTENDSLNPIAIVPTSITASVLNIEPDSRLNIMLNRISRHTLAESLYYRYCISTISYDGQDYECFIETHMNGQNGIQFAYSIDMNKPFYFYREIVNNDHTSEWYSHDLLKNSDKNALISELKNGYNKTIYDLILTYESLYGTNTSLYSDSTLYFQAGGDSNYTLAVSDITTDSNNKLALNKKSANSIFVPSTYKLYASEFDGKNSDYYKLPPVSTYTLDTGDKADAIFSRAHETVDTARRGIMERYLNISEGSVTDINKFIRLDADLPYVSCSFIGHNRRVKIGNILNGVNKVIDTDASPDETYKATKYVVNDNSVSEYYVVPEEPDTFRDSKAGSLALYNFKEMFDIGFNLAGVTYGNKLIKEYGDVVQLTSYPKIFTARDLKRLVYVIDTEAKVIHYYSRTNDVGEAYLVSSSDTGWNSITLDKLPETISITAYMTFTHFLDSNGNYLMVSGVQDWVRDITGDTGYTPADNPDGVKIDGVDEFYASDHILIYRKGSDWFVNGTVAGTSYNAEPLDNVYGNLPSNIKEGYNLIDGLVLLTEDGRLFTTYTQDDYQSEIFNTTDSIGKNFYTLYDIGDIKKVHTSISYLPFFMFERYDGTFITFNQTTHYRSFQTVDDTRFTYPANLEIVNTNGSIRILKDKQTLEIYTVSVYRDGLTKHGIDFRAYSNNADTHYIDTMFSEIYRTFPYKETFLDELEGANIHKINNLSTNAIVDGGADMYDDGNLILFDGIVQSYANALYQNKCLVLIIPEGTKRVEIRGNLGADGDGTKEAYGISNFGKYQSAGVRTYNGAGGDPTVNHLVVIDGTIDSHTYDSSTDVDDDFYTITGKGYLIVWWDDEEVGISDATYNHAWMSNKLTGEVETPND